MSQRKRYDSKWAILLHNKLNVPYILHVAVRQRPKRPRATVVFLHGIGNTGHTWRNTIERLPKDTYILSIDLLGHGASPKPEHATYNVQTQARAVAATLLRQLTFGKIILVGHSMGSLISVEVAKRYPRLVQSLILCSPPLYGSDTATSLPHRERQLKAFYRYLSEHPDRVPKLARRVQKIRLFKDTFTINDETLHPFLGALKGSILTQTAAQDAKQLRVPFVIIHGKYDPLVLKSYLKDVVQANSHGTFREIAAHHDIRAKTYVTAIVSEIEKATATP